MISFPELEGASSLKHLYAFHVYGTLTELLISWKPPCILTKINPFVCELGAVLQAKFNQDRIKYYQPQVIEGLTCHQSHHHMFISQLLGNPP